MMKIDAHQHFWRYDPVEHNWMTDAMAAVKKDFLPEDLIPLLTENEVDGSVLVQVTQTDGETKMLLDLAKEHDFIKGVVGWVDLRAKDIYKKLAEWRKFSKLKGFRHVLQSEEPDFMLQPSFMRGIDALKEFDFTYDILIYPEHLAAAQKLVEKFPEQPFVLDHLAKPFIKDGLIKDWQKEISGLASHGNVYCKISGMLTEADWNSWKDDEFTPYMDHILKSFGIRRIMYGSDWPMCLVAGSYNQVIQIVRDYFADFSAEEQALFFGENARNFYHLS
jgi:L-fuconolactonase